MRLPLTNAVLIVLVAAAGCSDDPTRVPRADTQPSPPPAPWLRTAGSTVRDECHDVAVDPSGNVFVTGSFSGAIDLEGHILDPAGGAVFVAKYGANGELRWVKQISGAGPDGPLRLGTDNTGDAVLQGIFVSRLSIEGTTVTPNGGGDHVFVARFDASGNVRWISYDTAPYLSVGFGMDTGPPGNTAVTGFLKAGATFGDSELTVQGFDFFLVCYDSGGNALWAKQTGSSTTASGDEVAVDTQGNVIVAGRFTESITLDGTELTADAGDAFIAKFDAAGELQWLTSIGDGTPEFVYGIATGRNGDVYVTGYSTSYTLWKLDSGGNPVWQTSAAIADDIALDPQDNIFLSGSFLGALTVGDSTVTSNGLSDFFIARYDASGMGSWVVSGGASRGDRAQGLAVDRYGALAAVADVYGSFEFAGETVTSRGDQDILIMRLE